MSLHDEIQTGMEQLDDFASIVERHQRNEDYRAATHANGHQPTHLAALENSERLDRLAYLVREACAEACAMLDGRERLPEVQRPRLQAVPS